MSRVKRPSWCESVVITYVAPLGFVATTVGADEEQGPVGIGTTRLDALAKLENSPRTMPGDEQ